MTNDTDDAALIARLELGIGHHEAAARLREQEQEIARLNIECDLTNKACIGHGKRADRAEAALLRARNQTREWIAKYDGSGRLLMATVDERDALRAELAEWKQELLESTDPRYWYQQAKAARAELERHVQNAERLADACNGMIGLVQLIASRPDLPTGLDDVMLLSHRVTEAKAAIDALNASSQS